MTACLVMAVFGLLLVAHAQAEYIRSDEITLEDNLETNAQIININRLYEIERGSAERPTLASSQASSRNYVFKLINDSSLVNYIDLSYLNDEMNTAVIILKKRINYEDVCDDSASSGQLSCQRTLKIVAINENDFIEIPVEIKKV